MKWLQSLKQQVKITMQSAISFGTDNPTKLLLNVPPMKKVGARMVLIFEAPVEAVRLSAPA
jgi:hypothetical protein